MNRKLIEDKFERIGARVQFAPFRSQRRFTGMWDAVVDIDSEGKVRLLDEIPKVNGEDFAIDVTSDRRGELFRLETNDIGSIKVLDSRVDMRHLLLFVEGREQNMRFLCGHDERQWYVAATPDDSPVSNVTGAIESLKPEAVRISQERRKVKKKRRNKRRNKGFVRQGEWFFVPEPDIKVDNRLILGREPLSRGDGSKPHIVDELFRTGGETVYVCSNVPQGITEEQRSDFFRSLTPGTRALVQNWNWSVMKRNPEVYARGRVRHKDHKTIELKKWHRVFMNTEDRATASRQVVFLD